MEERYDVLILTTPKDFLRVKKHYKRLLQYLPVKRLIMLGSKKVKELMDQEEWEKEVAFLDGDTVPCKAVQMTDSVTEKPFLDLKREYHEEYFNTLSKLLPGMKKCIEQSFISEHMLFSCEIMKELIQTIVRNSADTEQKFYERIIEVIEPAKLTENSFSEFETYGTFVAFTRPDDYRLRRWYSFRHCGDFFDPDTITDEDFEWLSHDFDAVSFEKEFFVREDNREIFTKKEYREKLSARQILEIVQEEYLDGYKKNWD